MDGSAAKTTPRIDVDVRAARGRAVPQENIRENQVSSMLRGFFCT